MSGEGPQASQGRSPVQVRMYEGRYFDSYAFADNFYRIF